MINTLASDDSGEQVSTLRRNRLQVLLCLLEAFVVGGFTALLLVNRLLDKHLDIYVAGGHMDEASTVLDLVDNLLAYLVPFGALSLLLGLVTIAVWIWSTTRPR